MSWWPEKQWAEMVAGVDCPMCADASLPTNPGSELVTELPWSYLRLVHNQTHAGYCVVILKQHLPELDDLASDQLAGFWADVATAAAAIRRVFEPRKLDYLVMGHRVPHLHCHVYPQYEDNDPLYNVNIWDGDVRQNNLDRASRLALLRAAIDAR